ncbi:MAG: hypothetical protein HON70_24410, partial [Lentisphaerae bacterium]|nr:hypothetical protein [Lentisphaerota bacterium]
MSDAAQQAPGTPLAAGSSFRARLPSAACAAALAVTVSALALPSILEASPAGQKGDAPSAFAAQMTIATLQDQIRADRVAIANELRAMATDYWELDCRTEALRALTRLLEVDDSGETDVLFAALCYATQGAPETATTLLLAWAERHAQHQPSIRLCRAISVFADAAGRSSTADEWRGRAAEERKDAVGQRWSAASWLSWAGLTDVAGSEREAILREAPASSTATYVLQARARNALATNQFTEAADAYIEAGRRHADRSGFSGRARMDGATGFACRAIALDLEGDDEGARAAMLCAERWAGGEPGSLGRLLWVLEKASPAPWVVALVR